MVLGPTDLHDQCVYGEMFIARAAVYLETGRNMQSRVLDLFGFAPLGFEKSHAREDVVALRLVIKFAAIAPLHVAIFPPGRHQEQGLW